AAPGEKTVTRSVVLSVELDNQLQEGLRANRELNLSSLVRAVLREHLGAFLRRKAGEAGEEDVALADPGLRGVVHRAARGVGLPPESTGAQLGAESLPGWLEQALERQARVRRLHEQLLGSPRPPTPASEAAGPPST